MCVKIAGRVDKVDLDQATITLKVSGLLRINQNLCSRKGDLEVGPYPLIAPEYNNDS